MYDLIKYVEMCTTPHNVRKKKITLLFDKYKDIMIEYYKHYGFRNKFIEELYEKSNMQKPLLIYSPRSVLGTRNGRILAEWLYANKSWHIFYDPVLYKDNKKLREKKFTIWLQPPDMLVYAILRKNKDKLIKLIADFLYWNSPWTYSENE